MTTTSGVAAGAGVAAGCGVLAGCSGAASWAATEAASNRTIKKQEKQRMDKLVEFRKTAVDHSRQTSTAPPRLVPNPSPHNANFGWVQESDASVPHPTPLNDDDGGHSVRRTHAPPTPGGDP